MRTKIVPVLAAAGLLVGLLGAGTSPAGNGYFVDVTKVVEGDGPSGPYGINVTCTNPFVAPAGPFDFTIEDGETVVSSVNFNDTCTVTETDDLGADSVTYSCATDGPGGGQAGGGEATCVDDQTVAIDVSDAGGAGTVTVTNTFDPEVVDEEPEPDTDADVVTATPSFTG